MDRTSKGESGLRLASAVPGRIRLQGEPLRQERLASVADELRTWPQVMAVDLRTRSASIVIRFDPEHLTVVADGLLALGVAVDADVRRVPRSAATVIADAAATGNDRLGQRLGGTDARVLIPLGLGLLAARRSLRGNERLADAPWYVLAWYASETFWKFHGGTSGAGRHADSRET